MVVLLLSHYSIRIKHIKDLQVIPSVELALGSCSLALGVSVEAREVIRLKPKLIQSGRWGKNRSCQISNLVNYLKRMNALTSLATPKGLEDNRRQLKGMMTELFP